MSTEIRKNTSFLLSLLAWGINKRRRTFFARSAFQGHGSHGPFPKARIFPLAIRTMHPVAPQFQADIPARPQRPLDQKEENADDRTTPAPQKGTFFW